MSGGLYSDPLSNFVVEVIGNVAKAFSLKSNTQITLFGASNGVYGWSLGISAGYGKGTSFTYSNTDYTLLSDNVAF
jgi:hypothetical protein